jgi:two-component system, OmpR family, phosphate regulon response regulator PhoB
MEHSFNMIKGKILVIEDDRALADVLVYSLRQAGYEVNVAYDGLDGINQALVKSPDCVLLDLMLPVVEGLDVCRRLRADSTTREMLIIMLTAKAEESDELIGFSLGADDYVTKPFSIKVLLERIKALRRRKNPEPVNDETTAFQGISVDRGRHRAMANGKPLPLTRSEFRLLDTLIRQPGRVFQRSELIDAALGEDNMVLDRTIDVHIRALRRKLGEFADVIETVRGVGYRFRDMNVSYDDSEAEV